MKVREYWPAFVDRNDPPREAEINEPEDALKVPWLFGKGDIYLDDRYIKMRANNFIVGIVMD